MVIDLPSVEMLRQAQQDRRSGLKSFGAEQHVHQVAKRGQGQRKQGNHHGRRRKSERQICSKNPTDLQKSQKPAQPTAVSSGIIRAGAIRGLLVACANPLANHGPNCGRTPAYTCMYQIFSIQ
jgi:hypothetical protein